MTKRTRTIATKVLCLAMALILTLLLVPATSTAIADESTDVMHFDTELNMYYHPVDDRYFYPAVGLYFCPETNRWFCPAGNMLAEGHSFVNINDLPFVEEEDLDDHMPYSLEAYIKPHFQPPEGCPIHVGMETLGMTRDDVNDFLTSLSSMETITREHFDIFYTLNLWLVDYQALRTSGRDWVAFDAFLHRSHMTLAELVAGLMLMGYSPAEIETIIDRLLSHDLDSHGVSFAWNAVPVYETWLDYYEIMTLSGNLPSLTISRGALTSTSVVLTGTITDDGGASIAERGFWYRQDYPGSTRQEITAFSMHSTFTETIFGLTPGTTYLARAIARHAGASGTGQSDYITFTTITDTPVIVPPGMPTGVNATPDGNQVTLGWFAPTNNGGASITHYEVSINNGPWETAFTTSWHVFTGLSNGNHTFRVRAVNSAGAGEWANASATVFVNEAVPPTLTVFESAITSNTVTLVGDIQSDGGAPITERGFLIQVDGALLYTPISVDMPFDTFSVTVEGLSPDTMHHARATARNSVAADTGRSERITFITLSDAPALPGMPQNLTPVPGAGQVVLTWDPPLNAGGSLVTGYEVSVNGGNWIWVGDVTTHTVTELAAGNHTFSVRAVSMAGVGEPASVTTEVLYEGPPSMGPPQNLTAPVDGRQVTLRWERPADSGGMPLSYEIYVNNVQHRIGITATEYVFPNLADGNYTFRVRARNMTGAGQWATITATVAATPAPTLNLPVNTWGPTAAATSLPFEVISNRAWTATVNAPADQWLSVASTTSNNMTLAVTANNDGVEREGTITVRVSNTLSETFTVTQSASAAVTITLNANGGNVNQPSVTVTGNTVGNALPTPTRSGGFVFAGWFTAATGGTQVLPTTVVNSNMTVFARWRVNITLNPNGGTVNPTTRTVVAGTTMPTDLPTPTDGPDRRGYQFDGWFTAGGVEVTDTTVVLNQHQTLTARWSMIWHCNDEDNRVGFWPGDVNIYVATRGALSAAFRTQWNGFVNNAIAAWTAENVLDMLTINVVTRESQSQMQAFGGARLDLEREARMRGYSRGRCIHWIDPGDMEDYDGWDESDNCVDCSECDACMSVGATRCTPTTWNGLAIWSSSATTHTITVDGTTRNVRTMLSANWYVVDQLDSNRDQNVNRTQRTTTHELGHALGYFGHAPDDGDVMYTYNRPNYTLQSNEIRHLRQIYRRFRAEEEEQ